ncbi:MAG: adenosylmethionine--8-amino-7-oxononanoate transaminase [Pirellulaceae bacterium]
MDAVTQRLWELDRRSLWHPFTRHSAMDGDPFPIISRGEGVYLYDTDGHRYVDAISSWWTCNLGHSHPRLVEAIRRQAGQLQHSILGNLSHPLAAELAAELTSLFPDDRRRVLFASDGACAVEASLRVAIQYWHNIGQPQRRRFVALQGGYHGDTWGAMSLGYVSAFHTACKHLTLPVLRADAPCCAGCAWGQTPDSCALECLENMRSLVEQHGHEIAAVIVEPLCQGAAGMRLYSAAYLRQLRPLCDQHGILLIADEIAMGMGRTGRMFAFEHAEIDPDIVCLGKGLTGGYLPMSATVVKQYIHETFADTPEDHTFYHGHTFAGNPLAAAAARECLHVYREEGIVQRAAQMGEILKEEMQIFRDTPATANLRCQGMIAAIDLDDVTRCHHVRQALLRKGILLRPLGNVIYLMLPLTTPEHVLRETVATLHQAIATQERPRPGR